MASDGFDVKAELQKWLEQIGKPENYDFERKLELKKKYDFGDFDGELYIQANGPDTFQRLLKVIPKNLTGKAPGVAVPFYFPEAMLGHELETGEPLPYYHGIEMLAHLAKRGYIAVSADAYHLTYVKSEYDRNDFHRWTDCAQARMEQQPHWSGIGKLTADTMLLVDALVGDDRVDSENIGITGHSLGGKMAFYAGCLDKRVKAIMVSDFGLCWEQTNWEDIWYWGAQVETLKSLGMEHSGLLSCAAPKPFCLIAGYYDNGDSYAMMCRAHGYENCPERLVIYNHATGHRPPENMLNRGYDFLDKWLK